MKTQFLKTTATMLLLIVLGYVCKAQNNNQNKMGLDSSRCLKLIISLHDMNNKSFEGATVKLIKGNKEEHSVDNESISRYQFKLKRNIHYTVEISSPGYITRRLAVSTLLPKAITSDVVYKHQVDITMIPETKSVEKSDFLDFPAGLISYNKTTDSFEADKKYTSCLKKDFDMAKLQARKEFIGN